MSIVVRIWLLVILAVAFGMIASFALVAKERDALRAAERVVLSAQVNPAIGGLVTELQRERGTSAGFIGANGTTAFAERLTVRRQATDVARRAYADAVASLPRRVMDEAFWSAIERIDRGLGDLERERHRIDELAVDVGAAVGYYTAIVEPLIGLTSRNAKTQPGGDITRRLMALQALLSAKEKAGLERAMGANGFAAERFPDAIRQRFIGLVAQQNAYLALFRDYAPDGLVRELDSVAGAPAFAGVGTLRERAIGGDDEGVSAAQWFDLATQRIDLIGQVEAGAYADLLSAAETAAAAAGRRFWRWTVMALVLGALVGAAGIAIARSVAIPIGGITGAMMRLVDGERLEAIPGATRRDEIGDMARAIATFRDQMVAADRALADHIFGVSTQVEAVTRRTTDEASAQSRNMRQAASTMQGRAGEIEERMGHASSGTAQASEAAHAVAAAIQELVASIDEVDGHIRRNAELVELSRRSTEATRGQMTALDGAANRIGAAVQLVADIAAQTNLLALNATIEAARAGEAGRGFTVVANNVKDLAHQTAQATDEIARLVAEIQSSATGAAEAVGAVERSMDDITTSTRDVGKIIGQQISVTRELGTSSETAAGQSASALADVRSVADAIAMSAQLAADTQASADKLAGTVDDLALDLSRVLADASMKERRRYQRAPLPATVVFRTAAGRDVRLDLVDVSAGGARCAPTSNLGAGDEGLVIIDGLELPARVLPKSNEAATHLAFLKAGYDVRERLGGIIEEARASAA